jgi:Mg-chelatase subunit ChlD
MLFMRAWPIISLLVFAGCSVRLPRPGELAIAVKTTTRVEARVQVQGQAQGQAQVQDAVVVPLQNAPVVEFFGIPLEGAGDIVFVLDCSGSMANIAQGRMAQIQPAATIQAQPPTDPATEPPPVDPQTGSAAAPPVEAAPPQLRKIDVAQAELVDALQRLPAGTRLNVLFFNNELEAFAPAMVALDETGRTNLIGFVKDTVPTGSTALAPAMRTAFLMNTRRIVLLSDGLGNVGGNADAVLRDAREAIRGGVRIDTIGLGRGQDRQLLGTLAGESGGLYQAL